MISIPACQLSWLSQPNMLSNKTVMVIHFEFFLFETTEPVVYQNFVQHSFLARISEESVNWAIQAPISLWLVKNFTKMFINEYNLSCIWVTYILRCFQEQLILHGPVPSQSFGLSFCHFHYFTCIVYIVFEYFSCHYNIHCRGDSELVTVSRVWFNACWGQN